MDKASDYESGDSRFESWQGRLFFFFYFYMYFFSFIFHFISKMYVSFFRANY